MASYNKFFPFIQNVYNKVFNLATDQLTIALSNTAPTSANGVLADIVEISYTNCSSRNVTTTSSTQTGGLYKLILVDLVLLAGGGTVGAFRYVVLYDNTAANDELIGWWDYGSSITLNDGETFTIDFSALNGVLTDT